MIHNPWALAVGDAREMRATATLLDQVGAAIRGDYARRTGLPPATIAAIMDDETWFEASEAVAKGFADALMRKPAKANASARGFDLSAYAHAPGRLAATADPRTPSDLEAARQRQERRLRLYR